MKKLMIAVAIVCAAVASQGASIAWEMMDGVEQGQAGYTVYVVSALSQFADVAAIQKAALPHDSGNFSALVEPGARMGESAAGMLVNADWETVDTVNFFYVLVKDDKSGYWTSDEQTAVVAKKTATPEVSTYVTLGTLASGQMTSFGVPEPTSGLLLLLGVAGLALRRKQA